MDRTYTIQLDGDPGVGRKSVLHRFLTGEFSDAKEISVPEVSRKSIKIYSTPIILQFFLRDQRKTQEFPEGRRTFPLCYEEKIDLLDAQVVLFIFDFTDAASLAHLDLRMDEYKQRHAVLAWADEDADSAHFRAVLGNKCDRIISPLRPSSLDPRIPFYPISAKLETSISDAFLRFAAEIFLRERSVTTESLFQKLAHKTFVSGNNSSECEVCQKIRFGWRYRPHHCRRCGLCICSKCSSKKKDLSAYGYRKLQRVCNGCFGGAPPQIRYILGDTIDVYVIGLREIQHLVDIVIHEERWRRGATSYVHRGVYCGTPVAIKHIIAPVLGKQLGLRQGAPVDCRTESDILSQCGGHPHVIKLLAASSATARCQFLVTPLYPDGTLRQLLNDRERYHSVSSERQDIANKILPYASRVRISLQTAEAILFLHTKEVVHLDLKAEHLLVEAVGELLSVCLFDLGTALPLGNNGFISDATVKAVGPLGTPTHIAPEVWLRHAIGTPADVYSFGVLLAEIFSSSQDPTETKFLDPFTSYPMDFHSPGSLTALSASVSRKTDSLRPSLPQPRCATLDSICNLIQDCWKFDPKERPTFKEIIPRLRLLEFQLQVPRPNGYPSAPVIPSPGAEALLLPGRSYLSIRDEVDAMQQQVCALYHNGATLGVLKEVIKAEPISALLQLDLESALRACTFAKDLLPLELDEGRPQAVKDNTVAGLLRAATVAQLVFETSLRTLIRPLLTYNRLKLAPIKTEGRTLEKMESLNERNKMCILDMNRATILCKTEAEFAHVSANMSIAFGAVLKMKNKFKLKWTDISEPPCLFYQLELKCPDLVEFMEPEKRWIVEVQVTTPGLYASKEHIHVLYEISRALRLPPVCTICGRDWPSP